MTEQKAIEYLEQHGYISDEVKDMAIIALEKQKPMKPVQVEDDGIRYTDVFRCPTCGGMFTGTGMADYCYHCGQKLEWDEPQKEEMTEERAI